MVNHLDYEGIRFPFSKKDYCKVANNTCINVFSYENYLTYYLTDSVSDQKFEYCMDLLFISNENKSWYVYIKYFNRFMCNKTKNKNKKNCLIINGRLV